MEHFRFERGRLICSHKARKELLERSVFFLFSGRGAKAERACKKESKRKAPRVLVPSRQASHGCMEYSSSGQGVLQSSLPQKVLASESTSWIGSLSACGRTSAATIIQTAVRRWLAVRNAADIRKRYNDTKNTLREKVLDIVRGEPAYSLHRHLLTSIPWVLSKLDHWSWPLTILLKRTQGAVTNSQIGPSVFPLRLAIQQENARSPALRLRSVAS